MKKAKKKSAFGSKIVANSNKQKAQGKSVGYLALPKNMDIFSPKPGSKITLDFLPYVVTDEHHMDRDTTAQIAIPGSQWYKKPYKVHRGIGANKESVVCPTTFGKRCPICEYRARRAKEGAEYEELKTLNPSKRNLYIVVPLDSNDFEKKPHIWDFSQYLFQDALNDELAENEEHGIFPDLEEGESVKIRFSEEQFQKNKYAKTSRIDFLERDEQYKESILKEIPNLDEVLVVLPYEDIEKMFFEFIDEPSKEVADDDDDDDEEKTVKKSLKKSPTKKEDDDEEEDEDDDDEEEVKPTRKKKKIEPEPEDDDDDSGDEDDEEDDDEEEDEDDDEEEDEDDDEEEEIKPKKSVVKKGKKEEIPKAERCVACSGTGKNSKGGVCKPCGGTGRKKEEKKVEKKSGKNKCPGGYVFGKDCEKYEACDDCAMWEDCMEAK